MQIYYLKKEEIMDIEGLSALVLQKIKEVEYYSELDDKALYKSIYKSLDLTYRKNLFEFQKRMRQEEQEGKMADIKKYEKAYEELENIVMTQANKIAASNRSEIKG